MKDPHLLPPFPIVLGTKVQVLPVPDDPTDDGMRLLTIKSRKDRKVAKPDNPQIVQWDFGTDYGVELNDLLASPTERADKVDKHLEEIKRKIEEALTVPSEIIESEHQLDLSRLTCVAPAPSITLTRTIDMNTNACDPVEACSDITPYVPNPLEMFNYNYKSGDKFVLEDLNITSQPVRTIKSFKSIDGIDYLVTLDGTEIQSSLCRPALPKELSSKMREDDPTYATKLLRDTLTNAQHKRLLQRDMGDGFERILELDSITDTRKVIFILHSIDKLVENLNARHIRFELKFAKLHNPKLYSDHNIAHTLPFYYAITRSMTSMGHSGFSHMAYTGFVDKVLRIALSKKQPLYDWETFHKIEDELCSDSSKDNLRIFERVLAPTSVLRNVLSMSEEQLNLLIELSSNGLRCTALTPLTLEDDEWFDHGYAWQNKRCGEVFKKTKDSTPYYRGILLCDDTETFRGFFSGSSSVLDLSPGQPMLEYCVYLNYGFEVAHGTTPDGDLLQYSYIPPRIEPIVGVTKIRKWDGSMYLFKGTDDEGNVYMTRAKDDSEAFVTQKEFLETGRIKHAVYPMWLALPEPPTITFED